jgi:hypothetical protein
VNVIAGIKLGTDRVLGQAASTLKRKAGQLVDERRQVLISDSELKSLIAQLQFQVCCRCRLRYCNHQNADHLFFDDPADLNFHESN